MPALVAAPDGIGLLAKQVTDAVQLGEEEYDAHQPLGARADLGRAMDLLVASGFDLQEDARLAALSRRIVESLHAGETTTTAQSESDRGTVASPLDEILGMTVGAEGEPAAPVDPQLRTSAEGELRDVPHDLPLTVNDTVLSFLKFFQTPHGRAIVETGLRRAGRYREMIQKVLREEGLPGDLMYIAQAESAFQPQALSRAGARGLWQFMAFRGKQYGLEHTAWVDDRQDPEKATRAAAHHLHDLYDMFGDWYLTMAAYNSGPGTVQKAVERTGYADFWEMYRRNVLPKETKNYVPIILAMTLIAKDPARYGITVEPEPALRADEVQPGHAIDLRLVADAIDIDLDTLRGLNPELLHLTTPADPGFVLRLPPGTAQTFAAATAAIPPDEWLSWRLHRVAEGETLSSISRQYHLGTAAIAAANDMEPAATLETGAKLIIPAGAAAQSATGKLVRYRTRSNDTLQSIADEFDVSVAELKSWNHLRVSRVVAGTRLLIYPGGMDTPVAAKRTAAAVASASAPADRSLRPAVESNPTAAVTSVKTPIAGEPVVHHVQSGETLWSIAHAYQTTVEALRAGNQFLFSRPLQAGDTLTILPHDSK
jgi:membrane-bound lytic murein transglycosylase D